ncbi:hypothetical protein K402DRAFT_46812 [Aulographum hederae CBS 113979]|uniref:Uncharacterized protein n=1 Tax=Aulographum hederae CBS 113979 TaxID=1176131 RepID=A0A6G1H464_9PEZI|nr:hypothetical protein K402DRAFT_46812 [Aulographum hederae CBS 113979]
MAKSTHRLIDSAIPQCHGRKKDTAKSGDCEIGWYAYIIKTPNNHNPSGLLKESARPSIPALSSCFPKPKSPSACSLTSNATTQAANSERIEMWIEEQAEP